MHYFCNVYVFPELHRQFCGNFVMTWGPFTKLHSILLEFITNLCYLRSSFCDGIGSRQVVINVEIGLDGVSEFFVSTWISNFLHCTSTMKSWRCYSIGTSCHTILLHRFCCGFAPKYPMEIFPGLIQWDLPIHFCNIHRKSNFMESESYENRENVFLDRRPDHKGTVERITTCWFCRSIKDNSQFRCCWILLENTVMW